MESQWEVPLLTKICLCGDGEVGKTSIKDRFVGKSFRSDYIPTLGADFVAKEMTLQIKSQFKNVRFQIWDLAGQPAFDQVRGVYFKGAVGAFLIFDVTRPDTMYNLEKWMNELSKHSESANISVIVLGNKIDLQSKKINSIDIKKAKKFITNQLMNKFDNIENNISFFNTSAKTGKNLEKAFNEMGVKICTKYHP